MAGIRLTTESQMSESSIRTKITYNQNTANYMGIKEIYLKFLLRFDSKNKVIKPYHPLFNLSREAYMQDINLITLFAKHY